jgi:hypothetical protein
MEPLEAIPYLRPLRRLVAAAAVVWGQVATVVVAAVVVVPTAQPGLVAVVQAIKVMRAAALFLVVRSLAIVKVQVAVVLEQLGQTK